MKADRSRPNKTGVGCDPQLSSEAAYRRLFWNGLQYLASESRRWSLLRRGTVLTVV